MVNSKRWRMKVKNDYSAIGNSLVVKADKEKEALLLTLADFLLRKGESSPFRLEKGPADLMFLSFLKHRKSIFVWFLLMFKQLKKVKEFYFESL